MRPPVFRQDRVVLLGRFGGLTRFRRTGCCWFGSSETSAGQHWALSVCGGRRFRRRRWHGFGICCRFGFRCVATRHGRWRHSCRRCWSCRSSGRRCLGRLRLGCGLRKGCDGGDRDYTCSEQCDEADFRHERSFQRNGPTGRATVSHGVPESVKGRGAWSRGGGSGPRGRFVAALRIEVAKITENLGVVRGMLRPVGPHHVSSQSQRFFVVCRAIWSGRRRS